MTKILAIESSCDETAAAVMNSASGKIRVLSSVVASQAKMHSKTNGVVPEVAARAHLQKINPVVSKALADAGLALKSVDYIAVTTGPGLLPSLLVGVEYAKALSLASGKPLLSVNHMLGHLYSPLLENAKMQFPSINLIVSGGHTYIVQLPSIKSFRVIGQTVDDAAGEAFDKVAKMLELGYPGGPLVSKYAAKPGAIDYGFPRPMLNSGNFDFSFAGLKTAVLYKIHNDKLDIHDEQVRANICFSFQNAAIDVLVTKTMRAVEKSKAKSVSISGGVAANKKLREELGKACAQKGIQFHIPGFEYCTDNAAMIGNAAAIMLRNGAKPADLKKVKADPNMDL